MSLIESLRPKTKRTATVTLISTVIILITYFVWTDAFITASIYIALLGPLAFFLLTLFDLLFSSVFQLWGSQPKTPKRKSTINQNTTTSTVEKSTDDLFNMEPFPA